MYSRSYTIAVNKAPGLARIPYTKLAAPGPITLRTTTNMFLLCRKQNKPLKTKALTPNRVTTMPANATTLMPETMIVPPPNAVYTAIADAVDTTPCAALNAITQSCLLCTNTSARTCVNAVMKIVAAGGKYSTEARITINEIEEEACLPPTVKSMAKASEPTPSRTNAIRPNPLANEISASVLHGTNTAIPMEAQTTATT